MQVAKWLAYLMVDVDQVVYEASIQLLKPLSGFTQLVVVDPGLPVFDRMTKLFFLDSPSLLDNSTPGGPSCYIVGPLSNSVESENPSNIPRYGWIFTASQYHLPPARVFLQ